MPNPTHPLFRGFVEPWMTRYRPDAFVEGVASWTATAILIVAFLVVYRSGAIPRFWVWFTGVFAVLSLGPFLIVGGDPTYIPGPWAILRFVPAIGMVRAPTRFAVMATLGVALVLAHVLATSRLGRRRGLALVGIGLLLGIETMGPPRRLFPAALPASYRVVAEDRCDVVVLRLPTGIKDGTRERGRFNTETQFRQVFHGKRLLGGYLSRLSDDIVSTYESHPTVRGLMDLSEGKALSKELRAEAIRGAAPLTRETRIGFIVINRRETSQDLRDFVQEAFRPEVLHKALPLVISVPFGDSCTNGECGHLPGCPHQKLR